MPSRQMLLLCLVGLLPSLPGLTHLLTSHNYVLAMASSSFLSVLCLWCLSWSPSYVFWVYSFGTVQFVPAMHSSSFLSLYFFLSIQVVDLFLLFPLTTSPDMSSSSFYRLIIFFYLVLHRPFPGSFILFILTLWRLRPLAHSYHLMVRIYLLNLVFLFPCFIYSLYPISVPAMPRSSFLSVFCFYSVLSSFPFTVFSIS